MTNTISDNIKFGNYGKKEIRVEEEITHSIHL